MYYLFDVSRDTKNYGSVDAPHQNGNNNGRYGNELGTPDSDSSDGSNHNKNGDGNGNGNGNPLHTDAEQDPLLPQDEETVTHTNQQQQEQRRRSTQNNNNMSGVGRGDEILTMDRAIDRLGMGWFQYRVLIAAGLFMAADSIQGVLLSFLSKSQQLESLGLTDHSHENTTRRQLLEWIPESDSQASSYYQSTEAEENAQQAMDDIQRVVLPAALMGAIVWGILGDMIGRRPAFVFGAAPMVAFFGLGTAVVSASPALSNDWLLFTCFFVAFGVGGVTLPFDLLSELVSLQYRARCLILLQAFFTVGNMMIHIIIDFLLNSSEMDDDRKTMFIMVPQLHAAADLDIAYSASWQWVILVVVCAIPCVLAIFVGIVAVPESPRWLLAKGHHEAALHILRQAATINNNSNSHHDGTALFPNGVILYTNEPSETLHAICNICAGEWMKITSALWATYFGMAFLDHGTLTLTVSVFSNDAREENFQSIFRSAAELAGLGLVWYTIDKNGRIRTQQYAYMSGGMLCLAISLLITPVTITDFENLLIILAFVARMVITAGICATWISTTEVLATEIRTSRHAIAHAVLRMGDFVAQIVFWQMTSLPAIGSVLLAMGVWTTLACSALPETEAKDMGVGYLPWTSNNNSNTPIGRKKSTNKRKSRQQSDGFESQLGHEAPYNYVSKWTELAT